MKTRTTALAALLLLSVASGCASIRHTRAMRVERTLAASGFQMKLATTPEQQQEVARLPQRKLVQARFEDELRYVYADGEYCRCLYVGTPQAFDRYRTLAAQQIEQEELASSMQLSPPIEGAEIERDETLATDAILDPNTEAALDWGQWGAWGPWF